MSTQTLSPDAIAALVDAAREGRLPDAAEQPSRPQRRVRRVDFTRPTKFTAEQVRRLNRMLEAFCRTASGRLSAELRMPLELEVINIAQLTWASAHAQAPDRSISATVHAKPADTRMMLSTEPTLILSAIELLLGGTLDGAPIRERRLTDIDWRLARHFLDRLLSQLSPLWSDSIGLELELGELEMHMDTARMAPVSEPTLAMTLEARLGAGSATLLLLLPFQAIAPVADQLGSREDTSEAAPSDREALRSAVGSVDMEVRAEVAAIEISLEEVLALRPGDVVALGARAEDGVTLWVGEQPVHRAAAGRSGGRRAAQVLGPAAGRTS